MIGGFPFLSFTLEAVLLGVAALGLLLAPPAGLVTGLVARSKGLSGWKYGAIGALYCALIILPWLHLTAQLSGKKPNLFCIVSSYVLLYAGWLFGQVCSFGVLNAATNFSRRANSGGATADEPYTALLLITLGMLAVSIFHILAYKSISIRRSTQSDAYLIPIAYLMPFIYIWVGHILFAVYVIEIEI